MIRDEIALTIQQEMSRQMRYPPAADLADALLPIVERVAREAAWSRRYDPEPLDDIVRRVMEGGQ